MKKAHKLANQPAILTNELDVLLARCQGAYSEKTLSGYRTDLKQFRAWCDANGEEWLPARPEAVAAFLDSEAHTKSLATVRRRFEAIKFVHRLSDLPSPTSHSEVRLALRRAARSKRQRPEQALGLTAELLEALLAACGSDLSDLRDAALVSVGYDTLCRSAELVAMRVEHLSEHSASLLVPRSKADPFGAGRTAYLSPGTVQRLHRWLEAASLEAGPLFRGLHTAKVSEAALDTASVRRIVKRLARRAGLAGAVVERLSGHSMRVGAAQDMMIAGIDTIGIMQAGGWRTYQVLARYVENAAAGRMHERRWQRLGQMAAA